MKACYADKTLNISKDDFEKPSELSINIDCTAKDEGDLGNETNTSDDDEIEIDF